jgi:ubiquinone/menaquinone biosynthesis C-methylase UbiE
MSTPATRGEQARQFYNAAATTATTFSFMNYGFGPLIPELDQSAEPERYCLQLYRHLLGDAQLAGKRVVEVSCGRGGGAAHLARVYKPREYIGVDISEENVALATKRFAGTANLRFMAGNAESLPLEDGSCDALVNVEAAHLYDDPAEFFREAFRVLAPGARLYHADLAWKDKDPAAIIGAAGFKQLAVEDITRNVLRSLDADSDRREAIVMKFPPELQSDFRDWSGVKGFRAYNRLASGEWVYRAIRATR